MDQKEMLKKSRRLPIDFARPNPLDRLKEAPASPKVRIRVDHELRVSLAEIPPELVDDVIRRLTFKNPLYAAMVRAGRYDDRITEYLTAYFKDDARLYMARGFANTFMRMAQGFGLRGSYEDYTVKLEPVDFRFYGSLYAYQKECIESMGSKRFGIISGKIGSGKKAVILYRAAQLRLPVVVIVHSKAQLYQWKDAAEKFLKLARDDIGLIGDGHQEVGRPFIVAIDKSFHRHIDNISHQIGILVIDRCDTAQLNIFFKFTKRIPSPYMFGVASGTRRPDKLTPLMWAYLGPVLHKIDIKRVHQEASIIRPVLNIRDTEFDFAFKGDYGDMVKALALDDVRNEQVVSDILKETADRGGRALVLCERLIHLEVLKNKLGDNYREAAMVSGKVSAAVREGIEDRFNKGKIQVVCVTAKSAGFLKLKKITHLFVVSPLRHGENLSQAVGMVLRAQGDEPAKVFDYRDRPEVLQRSYLGRVKMYREMGVEIVEAQRAESVA